MGLQTPQLVQCKACDMEFCSACRARWHPGQGCPETMPITFLPGETSSAFRMEGDDAPIKRCPKCKVYIERDEGCAQMMCKSCKHAFCWYCLESLDVSTAAGPGGFEGQAAVGKDQPFPESLEVIPGNGKVTRADIVLSCGMSTQSATCPGNPFSSSGPGRSGRLGVPPGFQGR
ncbi:Hypothetical predicted protein [Marmota monax]|uniref:RBR-type E3 ubiquitin transferase n=1 Tax=Marmota monax TaxID=9995 RepID=A0A5E4DBD9_MARMO|nr:Hypothetical predicted protein [Marmota monax]